MRESGDGASRRVVCSNNFIYRLAFSIKRGTFSLAASSKRRSELRRDDRRSEFDRLPGGSYTQMKTNPTSNTNTVR
jgi:hypothetical protein